MFTVIILTWSFLGMFFFQGELNTSFMEKYEEITGDVIEEDYFNNNFNDQINSFLYIFIVGLNGSYTDFSHNMVIL